MSGFFLQVEQVSKQYGSGHVVVQALNGLDFNLAEGSQVALVGPSGSGKTTLLNLIGTLDRPSSGRIHIGGRLVSEFNEQQAAEFRRNQVGFVFQDDALMPELTLAENVELPLVLLGKGRKERRSRLDELLTVFELESRRNSYPPSLSGGEKQRAAVARGVIHRPQLLLADEPTANLDAAAATVVLNIIQELATQQGLTVLLSSHDPRVFKQFPHQLQLIDGRLAAETVTR